MPGIRDQIAKERFIILIDLANNIWKKDQDLAQKYVKRAFDLKKKFKIKINREEKFSFCRKCFSPWIPGVSVDVSFDKRNKRVIYSCRICMKQSAFKYKD